MQQIKVCGCVYRYLITTNLSSRVRHFYPAWNEPEKNTSEYFDVSFLSFVTDGLVLFDNCWQRPSWNVRQMCRENCIFIPVYW